MVRPFGKAVREVDEASDCSICLYKMTVPSPRPMARWAKGSEVATVVTWRNIPVRLQRNIKTEVQDGDDCRVGSRLS